MATQKLWHCTPTALTLRTVQPNCTFKEDQEHFVSVQRRTLYMKTGVHFIVDGDIHLPQKHCATLSDMLLNNTQNALLHFHCDNGYANAPLYYIIRTVNILFLFLVTFCPFSCLSLRVQFAVQSAAAPDTTLQTVTAQNSNNNNFPVI